VVDGAVGEFEHSRALPTRRCWQYSVGFNPVAARKRRRNVRSSSPARSAIEVSETSVAPVLCSQC
jgi:hypothetical protein